MSLQQALEKIQSEMTDANHAHITVIGEFLLNHLNAYPDVAEKIVAEDKSIAGSIQAMANAAKEKAVNGMAMLTEQEGYGIVLNYFDIEGEPVVSSPTKKATSQQHKKSPKKVVQFPGNECVQITVDDFLSESEGGFQ